MEPQVSVRTFRTKVLSKSVWERRIFPFKSVLAIQEMCTKDTLNAREAQKMMSSLEELVNYAAFAKPENVGSVCPQEALASLVRAFLLADAVHVASEVLGDQALRGSWWHLVLQWLPDNLQTTDKQASRRWTQEYEELAPPLAEALSTYKAGLRPQPAVLVPLKRQVAGLKNLFSGLGDVLQQLRADDAEWMGS